MKNKKQSSMPWRPLLLFFGLCFLTIGATKAQNTGQQGKVQISGIVTDDKGEPIIGANIQVMGSSFATMTDTEGKFSFSAFPNADLKVTYIGFIEKKVKALPKMTIILSEDSRQLGEVVAIGYGAVKRANVLGSVVSLNAADIQDIPAGNLSQTLVGKLAAVNVSETTGRPGSTTALTIRTSGSFSTGSDTPLFVIDGVICDSQDEFDMLDPSDIESISILKDSEASVYGARAAGGAVIVTLKKGKQGPPKISYSGQFGLTSPTTLPEMLSAYDQAVLVNETSKTTPFDDVDYSGNSDTYTPDELEAFKDVKYNWLDYAWQNSNQLRNTVNISGGTDRMRYFAGGSLWNEKGNFEDISVKKNSLRASVEADITNEITASLQLSTNNQTKNYPYMEGDGEDNMNGLYKLLLCTSYFTPYKSGDNYLANGSTVNAIALLESESFKKSVSSQTLITGAFSYKPKKIPGLSVNMNYSYSKSSSNERQYVSSYTTWTYGTSGMNNHVANLSELISSDDNTGNEKLSLIYGLTNNYQLNASVNYNRTFGDHHLSGMFNYEQTESSGSEARMRGSDMLVSGLQTMDAFNTIDYATSSNSNSGRLGFIGRINYDYKGKYLLESSFREEASVKFSPENRWGFFPQMAVGWRVSEEDFFKDNVLYINYLKLRASAGVLGQDNGLGSFEYLYSYALSDKNPQQYFGSGSDNSSSGLMVENNGVVTKDVTWEKTASYNFGIDSKFFNGKIDFSVDAYFKHTWDIFDQVSVLTSDLLGTSGSSIPKINSGIVNAWGTDIELGYNGKIGSDINYSIKGNFSWGDNVVIKKAQDKTYIGTYAEYEGHSTNRGEYGYKVSGIFKSQDQVDAYMEEHPGMTYFGQTPKVGMLIFEDVARSGGTGETYYVNEKDGIVNAGDFVELCDKSGTPYVYGFSLGGSYKTLRVDMTFTGGWGGQTIMNKYERIAPTATTNVPSYWKDSWRVDNTDAAYPSVVYNDLNQLPSSFWMRSASVLRLRTVNLSYSIPQSLSSKIGIPSLRVFVTGTNLLTLYSAFDYKDANLSRYYDYPLLRSYNFGMNITF
jgi:TonB-linked SusC/RagA family outer membrane protein